MALLTQTQFTIKRLINPYQLQFSTPAMVVQCDSSGNPIGLLPSCTIELWQGQTKLDYSAATWSVTPMNCTVSNSIGLLQLTAMSADKASVLVQVVHNGVTTKSTITATKVYKGVDGTNAVTYSLIPEHTSIRRDNIGSAIPAVSSCGVMLRIGDKTEQITNYALNAPNIVAYTMPAGSVHNFKIGEIIAQDAGTRFILSYRWTYEKVSQNTSGALYFGVFNSGFKKGILNRGLWRNPSTSPTSRGGIYWELSEFGGGWKELIPGKKEDIFLRFDNITIHEGGYIAISDIRIYQPIDYPGRNLIKRTIGTMTKHNIDHVYSDGVHRVNYEGSLSHFLRFNYVFKELNTFTFSCELRLISGSGRVTIEFQDNFVVSHQLTNDWVRVWGTNTVTGIDQTYHFIDFQLYDMLPCVYEIRRPMLEYGTKMSDYTLAPEDVEVKLNGYNYVIDSSYSIKSTDTTLSWQLYRDNQIVDLRTTPIISDGRDFKLWDTQPIPPYYAGERWKLSMPLSPFIAGDILTCKTPRLLGSFASADWDNQELREIYAMNDDTVFDSSEKQIIRTQWEAIHGLANTSSDAGNLGSYSKLRESAISEGVSVSTFDGLYNNLKTYLNAWSLYATSNTAGFNRGDMSNYFRNYYAGETVLLNDLSKANAKTEVGMVQVPGQNLLIRSNQFKLPAMGNGMTTVINNDGTLSITAYAGNSNWLNSFFYESQYADQLGLSAGEDYCVVVWLKTTASVLPNFYLNQQNGYKSLNGDVSSTEYKRCWYTAKYIPYTTGDRVYHLGFINTIGTTTIKAIAIHRGNKPMAEWAPSEFDRKSDLNAMEYLSEVFQGGATELGNNGVVLTNIIALRDLLNHVTAFVNGDPAKMQGSAFSAGVDNFGTDLETKVIDLKHSGYGSKIGVFQVREDGVYIDNGEYRTFLTNKSVAEVLPTNVLESSPYIGIPQQILNYNMINYYTSSKLIIQDLLTWTSEYPTTQISLGSVNLYVHAVIQRLLNIDPANPYDFTLYDSFELWDKFKINYYHSYTGENAIVKNIVYKGDITGNVVVRIIRVRNGISTKVISKTFGYNANEDAVSENAVTHVQIPYDSACPSDPNKSSLILRRDLTSNFPNKAGSYYSYPASRSMSFYIPEINVTDPLLQLQQGDTLRIEYGFESGKLLSMTERAAYPSGAAAPQVYLSNKKINIKCISTLPFISLCRDGIVMGNGSEKTIIKQRQVGSSWKTSITGNFVTDVNQAVAGELYKDNNGFLKVK